MARWAFAIAFILAAILAFAIANEDTCSDFTTRRTLASVAFAVLVGALAATLLHGRHERTWIPWVAAVATTGAALGLLWVALIVNWVSECTA